MIIAIATNSVPKSAGVKTAFLESPLFPQEVSEKIEFILHGTPSGISDMPLSEEETLNGAKNRVKILRKEIPNADYYVGVE
jgi:non-canonical (house-cleaning) NTP pyrophosphatase